jgi:SAM-dependent methyltransferase
MNRPGRFLDVGCGLGETVRLFGDKGWDAEGIDADPSTERFHREAGIRARIGQFEEVETASSYDLIQIAHAIYFITDPMAFIHKVRERLAPGGVFGVVLADLMANADPSLPSYAHTFFPTGSSMRYALALAGFEVVLSKKLSGSIYIAARQAVSPTLPHVSPATIRLLYQTKRLRYAVIGRPYLALRQAAKTLLKPFRH